MNKAHQHAEYMTIHQLANYASLSQSTLRKWLRSGMPYYRLGRSIRVKRSEFDEWMRESFHAGGTVRQRLAVVKAQALEEVLR